MDSLPSGRVIQPDNVLRYLRSLQQQKTDIDLVVFNNHRKGTIYLREGSVLAAHTGILQGNGALLSLLQLDKAQVESCPPAVSVQKTVNVSLEQIHRFLVSRKSPEDNSLPCDEEALLDMSRRYLFQFRLKQAAEQLVKILRQNRFFYPAWLWQSRIMTRQDYIEKALDEASRWGNHDQDIWREARKMRPQLDGGSTPVKRCIFCWSILSNQNHCHHCKAYLTISSQSLAPDIKAEEIKYAIGMYEQAFHHDAQNSRVAYALAIGCYNIKEYQRSLMFMQQAARLAPQAALFQKSLTRLQTILRMQSSPVSANNSSKPASAGSREAAGYPASAAPSLDSGKTTTPAGAGTGLSADPRINAVSSTQPVKNGKKSIFIIEDSRTSRKVLSMILGRNGFDIFEAESGKDAIDLARTIRPDLVLLDVMLPDMTGYEILPQLKQVAHFENLPFIMLTGKTGPSDRMKGMLAGSNEYLTKPFNPEKLLSVINGYL